MRLTLEEHPEAIKRYRHIKPARGFRVQVCARRLPETSQTCTRSRGHRGPHVNHAGFGRVVAVWDSGSPAPSTNTTPVASPSRSAGPRRPVGLKSRPTGLLPSLLKRAVSLLADVDVLAMFVLLVAFIGFAIHWLILIMG